MLDTEMKCDVESVYTSPPNHTSSTSFHQLDASLFYSSAQSDVSQLPGFSRLGGLYAEYRVNIPDSETQATASLSPVFTLSEVTDGVDGDLLRAVFLLSDIVVLIYRLTATYVTVRALRRRFSACSTRRRPISCPSTRAGGQMVADGGSMLRSSSSTTALTSASGPGGLQDASNIYVDPQSLVVENCATILHRPGTNTDSSASSSGRRSDAKCAPGQLSLIHI